MRKKVISSGFKVEISNIIYKRKSSKIAKRYNEAKILYKIKIIHCQTKNKI